MIPVMSDRTMWARRRARMFAKDTESVSLCSRVLSSRSCQVAGWWDSLCLQGARFPVSVIAESSESTRVRRSLISNLVVEYINDNVTRRRHQCYQELNSCQAHVCNGQYYVGSTGEVMRRHYPQASRQYGGCKGRLVCAFDDSPR